MLEIIVSSKCKRDIRRSHRRGKNMGKFENIVDQLACQKGLADRYRDHPLSGHFSGMRECHVEPDWLLVYHIDKEKGALHLMRTGSHADLFGM